MFAIADDGCIKVEFDEQIVPTKIVQKGDKIAIGKKAPKNKWMYKISFNDEDEFIEPIFIPIEKAVEMVLNNEIPDGKTQVAVLKAAMLVNQKKI